MSDDGSSMYPSGGECLFMVFALVLAVIWFMACH